MKIELLHGGRVLPSTHHYGQEWVLAPDTGNYEVRLVNDSPVRRLAVLTVDGVNALDGTDGSHDGPGYVLDPWQSVDIRGWLRSNREAAAFSFEAVEGSYAAQTGRGTRNTGVVGVAVFDERPKVTYSKRGGLRDGVAPMSYASLDSASPTKGIVRRSLGLGTGYGERVEMHTSSTTFERVRPPVQVLTLRYGSRDQFRALDIPIPLERTAEPQAFPAHAGFVPPPANWRG
jgi:hypothetical protein